MLTEIKDNEGAHKRRMRIGRGIGCSKGKTGGRGGKGQTARTGVRIKGFEGGQMPIHRRLPKRGFNPISRIEYSVVNTGDLQKAIEAGKLKAKDAVTVELLIQAGLVRKSTKGVKLLSTGAISNALTITVARASKTAIEAVEKAGGKVTIA